MKRKTTDFKENPTHEKKRKSKGSPYLGDTRLVPRVKQYLEANKDKAIISVALMAEDLQATYSRDYGRKKKNAFRLSVEKAYECVQASLKKESAKKEDKYNKYEKKYLKKKQKLLDCESLDTSSDSDSFEVDEDSFSSDNPDYVIQPDTNAMNDCLKNLYRTTHVRSGANSKHGKAEQNPVFVIDRKGNETGRASSSKPDLHIESRDDIILDLDRSENSIMVGSDPDSHNNGSSNCTASRKMTRKQMNINQEEDAELIILETGSTVSDDCIFSETELNYPTSSSLDKTEKGNSEQRYHNTVTRKKDVITEKIKAEKVKATPHGKRHRIMEQTEPRLEKKKAKTSPTKKVNKKQRSDVYQSTVTFSDIGGNDKTLEEICKLLVHMKHPEVYERLGVIPPRGFLLHGPPGCGKTLMAHAIAGELELPFVKVAATELISGVSGESEEKIREIFELATDTAPCVLFIDEVDAITPKRETASKDMERRVVSQLLTCMDDLNQKPGSHVLVLGATNRPDSLDPALRRAGRFDREISLGIPDEEARYKILQVLCKGLRLEEQFDFKQLAHLTPGFVGADLMALTREAAIIAVNRVFQALQSNHINPEIDNSGSMTANLNQVSVLSHSSQTCDDSVASTVELVIATESSTDERMSSNESKNRLTSYNDKLSEYKSVLSWLKESPPVSDEQLDNLYMSMADFKEALCHVQPSAKREGFATIPDVSWEDVGALKGVREELQMAIMAPVQHPERFKALGLSNPPGILLAGPPGCGKTLLAKAIANESGINFISVKGPELLNMYVGESERAVRQVFQRAKNSAPCVIFFDELDALCPRRSGAAESGASIRVVNQLLTEMDGLETRKQVFIMAATNRPDIIDPAILRPGRLDKVLYVGMPNAGDRLDILKTITKNGTTPPLASDVDLKTIAEDKRCEGYTGADLAALVREAAVTALRSFMSQTPVGTPVIVNMANFDVAFHKVKPSVSAKDQLIYAKMKSQSAPTNSE